MILSERCATNNIQLLKKCDNCLRSITEISAAVVAIKECFKDMTIMRFSQFFFDFSIALKISFENANTETIKHRNHNACVQMRTGRA
jgi:hypothetical protein